MKYGALLIAVITTLLIIPLPTAQGSSEQSLETGIVISKSLENEQPNWDKIVSEQLNRRETQLLEKARLEAVEVARKAEEAKAVQATELARKARYIAPKVVKKAVYSLGSANTYSPGYCTWFVASRRPVPSGWGNARNWLANARAAGFATGNVPQVGAIAWTGRGALGHVAYVVAVNGNQVTVQDSNYAGLGIITTRLTSASEWVYIY